MAKQLRLRTAPGSSSRMIWRLSGYVNLLVAVIRLVLSHHLIVRSIVTPLPRPFMIVPNVDASIQKYTSHHHTGVIVMQTYEGNLSPNWPSVGWTLSLQVATSATIALGMGGGVPGHALVTVLWLPLSLTLQQYIWRAGQNAMA